MTKIKSGLAAGLAALVLATGCASTPTPATLPAPVATTSPIGYDPVTRAEAWTVYQDTVSDGEGCWADFAQTYRGLVADQNVDHDDDSVLALESILYPTYYHVWGPYLGACQGLTA